MQNHNESDLEPLTFDVFGGNFHPQGTIDLQPVPIKLSPHILEPYQEQGNDQCQSKRYFEVILPKFITTNIFEKLRF